MIIIDWISMAHEYLASVMRNTRHGGLWFGGKSILSVGDLFQLPAVEGFRKEDQVWHSANWALFRMIELDEILASTSTARMPPTTADSAR